MDTKKKELIGNFLNKSREWCPKGEPKETDSHDFGKDRVNSYGIYGQTANVGWVSVGTDYAHLSLQLKAFGAGGITWVNYAPPGTSKWNRNEHRRFCHIGMNWRVKALINHEVVVTLIGNTTTRGWVAYSS